MVEGESMIRWKIGTLLLGLTLLFPQLASAGTWGSFDTTRINYAGGVLSNGDAHDDIRAILTTKGQNIVDGTPTLTADYLGGVDIFYTSLLDTTDGILSAAEQIALQDWIAAGGTLIVTAEANRGAHYNSFLSFYGASEPGCSFLPS